jgi:hypothetical protein
MEESPRRERGLRASRARGGGKCREDGRDRGAGD